MTQRKVGKKEVSDKELNKMIDDSIKRQKGGDKAKKAEKSKGLGVFKRDKGEGTKEDKKKSEKFDPWSVLMHPQLAEKSMNMVELENKLVFMVKMKSRREDIKRAVEKGFGVKVIGVNTEITKKGKKAYVKLHPDNPAIDIASRLGML